MTQNKVQYQRGLSMPELFDRYGSPEQCEALVRAWRWPQGFACPRCKGGWHSEFRRQDRLYFQCSACRYQCSLVSGTVFESSKLPHPPWVNFRPAPTDLASIESGRQGVRPRPAASSTSRTTTSTRS